MPPKQVISQRIQIPKNRQKHSFRRFQYPLQYIKNIEMVMSKIYLKKKKIQPFNFSLGPLNLPQGQGKQNIGHQMHYGRIWLCVACVSVHVLINRITLGNTLKCSSQTHPAGEWKENDVTPNNNQNKYGVHLH